MKNIKNITVFSILALSAFILNACVSPYQTLTEDVAGFDRISIRTIGEFIIEQGETESLEVNAPRDFLRYLVVDVEGSTLVIRTRRGYFGGPVQKATFNISVKDLNEVTLSGAGAIKMFTLGTDTLEVNLTGAGSVEIDNLTADRLEVNLTSAGAIIAAGEVDKQYITITGVGSYEGGDLRTEDTDIELTGAGSAVVWAEEDLDVEVTGVGSVSYFGDPHVYQNISGLGTVNSKGAH